MGPVSAVRPSVQTPEIPPSTAGIETRGAAVIHGARTERAVAGEVPLAVAPTADTSRNDAARAVTDHGFAVESAKAQMMAAQRAYEMASLVAGLNPLNDPVA